MDEKQGKLKSFVSRFGLILVLTLIVYLLPTPQGLSCEGHRALVGFVFMGALLGLQPVSLPIAGLMIPVALISLGLANSELVFKTYSSPIIFLILGSLFLAEALRKHGLARRFALMFAVSSGGGIKRLLLSVMGVSAFLSLWVENTAVAAVLIPIVYTISSEISDPKKARELLLLLMFGIC